MEFISHQWFQHDFSNLPFNTEQLAQASLFYDHVSRLVLNVIKNNGNPIPTSFFSFECYILEIFAKICIYTITQHDDVALREWDRNDKKASKIKK